jgi:hypothetical protein
MPPNTILRMQNTTPDSPVAVERGKPFIAQRVVTSVGHNVDGTRTTVSWIEIIARDSKGRVRFEQQNPFKPPDWRSETGMSNQDIEKIALPSEASGPLVATFDCFNGMSMVLQPELQIAHVIQTSDSIPPIQEGGQHYSHLITMLLSAKRPPKVLVGDLGHREIEGITAHGIRSTTFGTDKDGEWNGRPIIVWERWMSDELRAALLDIQSDTKTGTESKSSFSSIKRIEPEASFFEIPNSYKVNLIQATPEFGIRRKTF